MKIVTLEPREFDEFAKNHKYKNYYQTSNYGNTMLKFGYNVHYLGMVDDNNSLIGATLIIYKEVFMGNKVAYAPRGILFDYTNSFLVTEMTERLRQILGKQGFMLLRMDPLVPSTIRDNEGNIINLNSEVNIIMANIKSAGFTHKGNNLFFETEKPRFESLVIFNKDIRDIYKNFDKRTRHKIKKATNAGVEIYKSGNNDISILYEFIKRKQNKPIEFYKELCKNFDDAVDVYYAKLNTELFVINSKRAYENEMERNDMLAKKVQNPTKKGVEKRSLLNKKMESDKLINTYKKDLVLATRLLKEYPEGIILGGSLNIRYDNAAFLVIEGFNTKFKALNSNYLLKWNMILDYYTKGLKYFNLNAVAGEFKEKHPFEGLNEMKLGFNTLVSEYIGEFDIILNNFSYNIYKGFKKDKSGNDAFDK